MQSADQLDLRRLSQAVRRGLSVDVFGATGSGKSALLRQLTASLHASEWKVLTFTGNASFRGVPLAALALGGLYSQEPSRPQAPLSSVTAAVDEVTARVTPGASVILIDDWDDIDEASWGVARAVRMTTGVPVVTARLPPPLSGDDLPRSMQPKFGEARELWLAPLSFSELSRALEEHVDGPIDGNTLSRIYSKSSGNPGHAIAIVDAAVEGNKLAFRDGVWRGGRDLWTDTLGAATRTILARLTRAQQDLLEVLSAAGSVDLDSAHRLTDLEELERLESLGLVSLSPTGDTTFVSVEPPLLVEYFRHHPSVARRFRLRANLTSGSLSAAPSPMAGDPAPGGETHDAQLVRLVREQQRIRLHQARNAWALRPSVRTAGDLVRTLLLSGDPDEMELVAIEAEVEHLTESAQERVEWALIRSETTLTVRRDPHAAVEVLEEATTDGAAHQGALLARRARIEMIYRSSLQQARALELPAAKEPACVRHEVLTTLAILALVEGRIAASVNLFAQADAEEVSERPLDHTAAVFALHAQYLDDNPSDAVGSALELFDSAREQLDVAAMLAYGTVAANLLTLEGRHTEAQRVLEHTNMLGTPEVDPAFTPLMRSIIASVLASRRGNNAVAQQRTADLALVALPDIPLPGGNRLWAQVQSFASGGKRVEASEIALVEGDRLWDAGSRLVAAYAYLGALDANPSPEILAAVHPRLASIDGSGIPDLTASAHAWVMRDRASLMQLAARFTLEHRYSLALTALARAEDLARAEGDSQASRVIAESRSQVLESVPSGIYDQRRGSNVLAELSNRELSIARLARDGLSNQQIADKLVLSVRTVESHIYRAMRKLGVERRAGLADFFPAVSELHN